MRGPAERDPGRRAARPLPPDISMKRPVPLHLQAHSLRAQPADGDDLDADDFDDAASNCSWSAWDDPPLLPKAAPPLHSSRPRWPFRRRLYAAPAAADPADDLPSPEDEPSFTDTLMELCGTLDEFPGDDPALGESLLDDEITQAFPRVAAVRPPASPDTGLQPPPDLGNLALSDPQIPSDVIIVDVAVDNHTQGIVIEDGPCAGVSLATILPFVPPRPAIPRKVRTDEPVAAASEKLPPRSTVSAPAAAPAQAQRAPVERRHTLPAGMHIDLSQHHAPIPRGPASAVAPRTLPPREVAPPLRRVLRSPHAPIAAAAQELATPSQPRHPVINTQRRRDTDAPASAVSAPTPTAGPASAPPAAAPVPLGPRRATEPSIPVTASAPPRPAPPPAVVPPPTLKTEAVLPVQPMVGSPMVASPMITSPVLVSPQEPPAAVAPAPAAAPAPAVAGEAPRPAPRRPGRPPKSQQYKPPPAASRYSTRSSGPTPNPLPTPDATRPTTPLAPVPLDPNAPRQYDEGQQLVAPFVKRGPGRPKKQASVVIPPAAPDAAAQAQQAMHVQPVEAKLEVPAPLPVPTEPIVVMSRAASPAREPSPKRIKSPELPKIHSPAPAGASSPAPEHEEVHETVEIAQEQQQDDGLARRFGCGAAAGGDRAGGRGRQARGREQGAGAHALRRRPVCGRIGPRGGARGQRVRHRGGARLGLGARSGGHIHQRQADGGRAPQGDGQHHLRG
ncbi:hypothetical protein DFJ74DRAFT_388716 [Hyaloraphidium curvatum]|nr:hypothetical protein DFJ74DRAFT_388716 [Hyaloraphidium curvatum]